MNIPLILTLSILPDIDFLIPMLQHGGPTHSVILTFAIALPAILAWKAQPIPYLAAFVSHPLLGDYLTYPATAPGVQLFYPITSAWFSAGLEAARALFVPLELALFVAFLTFALATRDIRMLTRHDPSNFVLLIPLATVVLPVLLDFPLSLPSELIIPHLITMLLLALPIIIDIAHAIRPKHDP
jgi:hypothetical protein